MITAKNINGIKCSFNHDHYLKVRKVHELKNKIVLNKEWNHYYHAGNQLINHELLYKVIRDKETKELYIITKVLRQFYAGFHIVIQYDTIGNSSGIVHLDNGTSIALPNEADFYNRFEVTDLSPTQFFETATMSKNAFGQSPLDWFNDYVEMNNRCFIHFAISQ